MSRIIAIPSTKSKPARRTPRPDAPFGSGVFQPRAGREPYTKAEADWWAEQSREADDIGIDDIEGRIELAAYLDSIDALTPPAAICRSCGDYADTLTGGICRSCLERAADDASVASANYAAGLGYRVF